jgi:hemerythrin-like domain-containing protein
MAEREASELLRGEHRRIEDVLDRLLVAAKHPDHDLPAQLRAICADLDALEEAHFQKEEGIFYPQLRPCCPRLLDEMDEQHAYAREIDRNLHEVLAAVRGTPTERQMTELVRFAIELHDTIQHHIVEEEDHLFRIADAELPAETQAELARAMRPTSFAAD